MLFVVVLSCCWNLPHHRQRLILAASLERPVIAVALRMIDPPEIYTSKHARGCGLYRWHKYSFNGISQTTVTVQHEMRRHFLAMIDQHLQRRLEVAECKGGGHSAIPTLTAYSPHDCSRFTGAKSPHDIIPPRGLGNGMATGGKRRQCPICRLRGSDLKCLHEPQVGLTVVGWLSCISRPWQKFRFQRQ